MIRKQLSAVAVAFLAVAMAMPQAFADEGLVRTEWPSAEDPGLPFYHRFLTPVEMGDAHIEIDGDWAAVYFYRDPGCIPEDFNMMFFFDIPIAFGCPHEVTGFHLWHGMPSNGSPKAAVIRGDGSVPVWFVPASVLEQALGDGELTMGELEGLDGLVKGSASRFSETIHPDPLPPFLGGGGHDVPKIALVARGRLEDGRTFFIQATEIGDTTTSSRVVFR